MKDGERKMKVRFVGREYKLAEHRKDLFSSGATRSAGRLIDFLALKMGLETFEAHAVGEHYQAFSVRRGGGGTSAGVPRTPHQRLEETHTFCGDYDVSRP